MTHPPTDDLCSSAGAVKLKRRIEDYWRERGFIVSITLEGHGFAGTAHGPRYDLRSDMRNGLPIIEIPFGERFTERAA